MTNMESGNTATVTGDIIPEIGTVAHDGASGGGGGGGNVTTTKPHKPSPLELATEKLQALIAEQDTWKSRAEKQSPEDETNLKERIKRTQALINILGRKPSGPTDTCVPDGKCELCAENDTFPLFGCSHSGSFCGPCFIRMKETNPIRKRMLITHFDSMSREVVTLDAITCPNCRGEIATSEETLVEAIHIMDQVRARTALLERERLEDQARAVIFQREEDARRVREEEIRREQAAEFARIAELNRREREKIIAIAHEREQLRNMAMKGETIPFGTVFHPLPPRSGTRCCSIECQIPRQVSYSFHIGRQPEVLVTSQTACTVCRRSLFSVWDEQAVASIRAEEQRRIDELYLAVEAEQERHRNISAQLEVKSRLITEASELERPFRECLEQELAAAGENHRAREKAQAKFERNVEEAQRKWSRKHRSKRQ